MNEANPKTDKALAALDAMATIWAAKIDLPRLVRAVLAVPAVPADMQQDMLTALIKQAHVEGLYEGRTSHDLAPRQPASALENMGDAISNAVDEDASGALSILTGAFVGLTFALLKQRGHVPTGEISIDGGKGRDITIHAKKEGNLA